MLKEKGHNEIKKSISMEDILVDIARIVHIDRKMVSNESLQTTTNEEDPKTTTNEKEFQIATMS